MAPVAPQGETGECQIGMDRWLQAKPIKPGLANIQGRLGFERGFSPYPVLLDCADPPASMPRTRIRFLLVFAQWLCSWSRVFKQKEVGVVIFVRSLDRRIGVLRIGGVWSNLYRHCQSPHWHRARVPHVLGNF